MAYKEEQRKKALNLLHEGFFNPDRGGGTHGGYAYEFVLKDPNLNIWDENICNKAIKYFEKNRIEWHSDGQNKTTTSPEGHLLSSNIACINHLFYVRQNKKLADLVLQNIDSRIKSAEEIEGGYVAFEVNGKENYLNERSHTRGALSTSIDAAMVGKRDDGKNILVLIEWKYTECYSPTNLHKPAHDEIYKPFLEEEGCPIKIDLSKQEDFQALYYEPFYQLMRQTLLGWKMVENNEFDCNEYLHVHVIPEKNIALLNNVTASVLKKFGNTICEAWKGALIKPDRYKIVSPEHLLKPLTLDPINSDPEAKKLLDYLKARYWDV
jgi:hypothetical protein